MRTSSVAKLQDYVGVRTIEKSLSNRTYVLEFATVPYAQVCIVCNRKYVTTVVFVGNRLVGVFSRVL